MGTTFFGKAVFDSVSGTTTTLALPTTLHPPGRSGGSRSASPERRDAEGKLKPAARRHAGSDKSGVTSHMTFKMYTENHFNRFE